MVLSDAIAIRAPHKMTCQKGDIRSIAAYVLVDRYAGLRVIYTYGELFFSPDEVFSSSKFFSKSKTENIYYFNQKLCIIKRRIVFYF